MYEQDFASEIIGFNSGAKLAFLVFGPMMDLKLLILYSAVFQKRFVVSLSPSDCSLSSA